MGCLLTPLSLSPALSIPYFSVSLILHPLAEEINALLKNIYNVLVDKTVDPFVKIKKASAHTRTLQSVSLAATLPAGYSPLTYRNLLSQKKNLPMLLEPTKDLSGF